MWDKGDVCKTSPFRCGVSVVCKTGPFSCGIRGLYLNMAHEGVECKSRTVL